MSCYFADYVETEFKRVPSEEMDALQGMIDEMFLFATIWSVMATCDAESRAKFSTFLRTIIAKHQLNFPEDDGETTVYDFQWNKEKKIFESWSMQFSSFEVNAKLQYHEIMIPTNDSTRNIYLKKLLLSQGYHVMCPGPTGTGKSQNCYSLLT